MSAALETHRNTAQVRTFSILRDLCKSNFTIIRSTQHDQTLTSPSVELQGGISLELVRPKQIKLAEVVEMIHTASLIHDDVIDEADTRRNVPAANIAFTSVAARYTFLTTSC
jgi:geranylgeranyl pyrophosphate synthase